MGLERFAEAKTLLKEIISTAYNDGVISLDEQKDLLNNLERARLRIGFIGQIKTGKSTLINALIFRKPVMPVSATPMTASLCFLTYGDKPKVEVEFFSKEDWDFIVKEASKKETNSQWAKELVDSATAIKGEIGILLDSTRSISFSDLEKYVGKDGKYVPLVKALKIDYPLDILKDVEIVDTPGINDPIVSRERRTMEFLKDCDVVLFVIYAGRPFDKADYDLLDRLLASGVGKTCFVLNKIDTILEEEGNIEKAKQRIMEAIQEHIKTAKKDGETIKEDILKEAQKEIICVSSLWAMLGSMKEEDIKNDEDMFYHYEKTKKDFPQIKTLQDFYTYSRLPDLIDKIMSIVEKNKIKILMSKPASTIYLRYNEKLEGFKRDVLGKEKEIKNLDKGLKELERELKEVRENKGKFEEYISTWGYNARKNIKGIQDRLNNIILEKIHKFYKDIINSLPEKKGWFEKEYLYKKKCVNIIYAKYKDLEKDLSLDILKYREELIDKIEKSLKELRDYIIEGSQRLTFTHGLYMDLLNNVFETISQKLKIDLSFPLNVVDSYKNLNTGDFFDFLFALIKDSSFLTPFFGLAETISWGRTKSRYEIIEEFRNNVENIELKVKDQLENYFEKLNSYILQIKGKIESQVINPVEKSIQEAIRNKDNKEQHKAKLMDEISKLNSQISVFEQKRKGINDIIKKYKLLLEDQI
jgi:hypothetical protein